MVDHEMYAGSKLTGVLPTIRAGFIRPIGDEDRNALKNRWSKTQGNCRDERGYR